MRRICAVLILVVGGSLLLAWFKGLLLQGFGLGLYSMMGGVILLGLSFISAPPAPPDAPPPLNLGQRLTNLFTHPARVFRSLRAHPRFATAFLTIVLCTVFYNLAFTQRVGIEVIISSAIDKHLEGQLVPPSQMTAIKEQQLKLARSPLNKLALVVGQGVTLFIVMTVLAALYLLGITVTGGRIHFLQALAMVFHSALPPVIIHSFLSLILLYVVSPANIDPLRGQRGLVKDNLAFLFAPDSHPVLYTVTSFIGFISLYGLWLTAKGLRHASEKSGAGAAWAVAMAVWLLNVSFNVLIVTVFPKSL